MRGRAFKAQPDLTWIGARSNPEVIFELPLIPVINQVDARINRSILHAGKLRNALMPFGRIVPDKIVALSRQWRISRNLSCRGGSLQAHANYRTGIAFGIFDGELRSKLRVGRRPMQLEHRLVGG